jgi:cytochrome c peroxidase
MIPRTVLVLVLVGTFAFAQQKSDYEWKLPPGVPPPRVPAASPMTAERVELGRHLFYDTRLSGNGKQSCASCHLQKLAFTDGRGQAIGSTEEIHPRSSMSLMNAAYRDSLTWANPTLRTFEDQVLVPLFGTKPVELGLEGHETRVYAQLAKDRTYKKLFAAAFPGAKSPVNTRNIAAALSSFLRSIVSFRSPFDRYRFQHDESALSPAAKRGMELFFSSNVRCGGCHMAHNVSVDLGLNLDGGSKTSASPASDPAVFMYHNTGLYNLPAPMVYPADSPGLYAITGQHSDVGKFRVPTLRNIAVTAPYMHDGSIATLDQVLDHYAAGGRARNPRLSDSIKPLTLSEDQRQDLLAFLQSLTDEEALRDPRWSNPFD